MFKALLLSDHSPRLDLYAFECADAVIANYIPILKRIRPAEDRLKHPVSMRTHRYVVLY